MGNHIANTKHKSVLSPSGPWETPESIFRFHEASRQQYIYRKNIYHINKTIINFRCYYYTPIFLLIARVYIIFYCLTRKNLKIWLTLVDNALFLHRLFGEPSPIHTKMLQPETICSSPAVLSA